METSLGLFLGSAAVVSLTGVMLPGPLTAATVAKGYGDRHAGARMAAGHAVIEVPIIALLYLGFTRAIISPRVEMAIYLAGGLMMVYLGVRMLRTAGAAVGPASGLPTSSFVTGIVITGANPAFYIWWVTVGASLVGRAAGFGLTGVVLFGLVHLPFDFVWSEFLSAGTFESRRWWTKRVQKIVFTVCALILAGFGVWFCVSAFR